MSNITVLDLDELLIDGENRGTVFQAIKDGHVTLDEASAACTLWKNGFLTGKGEELQAKDIACQQAQDLLKQEHTAAVQQLNQQREEALNELAGMLRDETAKVADLIEAASEKDALIAQLEAEVIRLTPPAEPDLVAKLDHAFTTLLTPEEQVPFLPAYAIVRVLVRSGKPELAKAYVQTVEVPEELAQAKEDLLALFE